MALVLATSQGTPQAVISVWWVMSQGILYAGYQQSSSGDLTNVFSGSWSADFTYLRIHEMAGTTYWDSSADGTTWINRGSISDPIDLTVLYAGMYGWDYNAGDPATTLGFSDFAFGPLGQAVAASAVILAPDNSLIAASGAGLPESIFTPFTYGNSEEDIRQAVAEAVRAAANDATLDVSIIA